MAARRAARRRSPRDNARRRPRRDLRGLVPGFLRPGSRSWIHWNRATVEILQGFRAALDECIDATERAGRRREAGQLRRIEVR